MEIRNEEMEKQLLQLVSLARPSHGNRGSGDSYSRIVQHTPLLLGVVSGC